MLRNLRGNLLLIKFIASKVLLSSLKILLRGNLQKFNFKNVFKTFFLPLLLLFCSKCALLPGLSADAVVNWIEETGDVDDVDDTVGDTNKNLK